MAHSVGIIGGADGPTAIFLGSRAAVIGLVIAAVVAVFVIAGIVIAVVSKKDR